MLLVLISLYAALENYEKTSALFGILSMAVRQNNIVWLFFIFLLLYVRRYGYNLKLNFFKEHLKNSWLFLIGFALFGIFLVLNKGIAIGDKEYHTLSIYFGNIYLLLFLFFFLFLPLNISNFNKIMRSIRNWPIKNWPIIGIGFVFFLLT